MLAVEHSCTPREVDHDFLHLQYICLGLHFSEAFDVRIKGVDELAHERLIFHWINTLESLELCLHDGNGPINEPRSCDHGFLLLVRQRVKPCASNKVLCDRRLLQLPKVLLHPMRLLDVVIHVVLLD